MFKRMRENLGQIIAPGLRTDTEIRDLIKIEGLRTFAEVETLVKEEVARAKAALPITANYDPNNEGYRRISGNQQRRDLTAISQDRMFKIAYFMMDSSAMTRRLARLDKTFLFAEPITVTCEDEAVQEIIDNFWEDPENNMDLDFPDLMMWLGILGEQCWPVDVNKHNGHVRLGYVDPAQIKDIYVSRQNVKQKLQVELQGTAGRQGKKYAIIRTDYNVNSQSYGRLVGDAFFFSLNHPPNSPRGRSDFLTLFDWIDGLERYEFNYLERAEFMLNFVWDVLLKGFNEEQIREWLRDNPAPEPGSMRAHNENVEWAAVSPDIKAHDNSKGYETAKSFIMGAAGRPDAWFGGGGKAYQTEAEGMNQVPIKDLDERQLYCKYVIKIVMKFVVDQAVIAGRLPAAKADENKIIVNMPEISKKDLAKMVNGIPQLATALAVAETQKWITRDTATKIFAFVAAQFGAEVDAEAEIEAAKNAKDEPNFEDYLDK